MNNETDSLGEAFGKIAGKNPGDDESAAALCRELAKAIKTLPPREQDIIALRFGLLDGGIRTLEEIGKKYGVTRERIRQLEAKALEKIRLFMNSSAAPKE